MLGKLVFVGGITVWLTASAYACSCQPFESAEDQVEQAEVAFIGTAVESGPLSGPQSDWDPVYETRFRVRRSFKGPNVPVVNVRHRREESMCGVRFPIGREVLVLGWKRADGDIATSLCIGASPGNEETLTEALEARALD